MPRAARSDALYRNSGNVLLDRILGATLYSYPEGEDEEGADRRVGEIARELLETANPVAGEDVRVMDDFLAPGYGRLNPPTVEAGGVVVGGVHRRDAVGGAYKTPLLWGQWRLPAASCRRRVGAWGDG